MSSNNEYRYEVKIPMQKGQFIHFENSLKSLGLYPKRVYQDRVVHSIYLDNAKFTSYLDNVSGASNRIKVRVRYYDNDTKNLRLEYKTKTNKTSSKNVFDIENKENLDLSDPKNIKKLLSQIEIPKEILSLYPVLEVEYKRSYFTLAKDIRMTIDRDIKYKKLYPLKSGYFTSSPVYSVVEFKYPTNMQSQFKKLLYNLPFRIFRHSKYVVGMDTACVF